MSLHVHAVVLNLLIQFILYLDLLSQILLALFKINNLFLPFNHLVWAFIRFLFQASAGIFPILDLIQKHTLMIQQLSILGSHWLSFSWQVFIGNGQFAGFEVKLIEFFFEGCLLVLARSQFGSLAIEIDLEKVDIRVFVVLSSWSWVEIICSFCILFVEARELIIFCHFFDCIIKLRFSKVYI